MNTKIDRRVNDEYTTRLHLKLTTTLTISTAPPQGLHMSMTEFWLQFPYRRWITEWQQAHKATTLYPTLSVVVFKTMEVPTYRIIDV